MKNDGKPDEATFMVNNPKAYELAMKCRRQLDALLIDFGLIVHESYGRHAGYTATDEQCKWIAVEVHPGRFEVDITTDIAKQVSAGLRSIADQLRADDDRLDGDVTFDKFRKPL